MHKMGYSAIFSIVLLVTLRAMVVRSRSFRDQGGINKEAVFDLSPGNSLPQTFLKQDLVLPDERMHQNEGSWRSNSVSRRRFK